MKKKSKLFAVSFLFPDGSTKDWEGEDPRDLESTTNYWKQEWRKVLPLLERKYNFSYLEYGIEGDCFYAEGSDRPGVIAIIPDWLLLNMLKQLGEVQILEHPW